jgi:hypothetical protein
MKKEPSTKHNFATSIKAGMRKLTLSGVGVRIKQIGNIELRSLTLVRQAD